MEKKELLYEGKAKKVYTTDDPQQLIVSYKDDATAFNGLKKGTIAGKGVINNKMSNLLMARLEKEGIPTHLVEELSERETLVKKVSIVPLEVIVRNISAGSFAKRYGVEEGIVFEQPTFELSYKNDDLGDPLMSEDHALAQEKSVPFAALNEVDLHTYRRGTPIGNRVAKMLEEAEVSGAHLNYDDDVSMGSFLSYNGGNAGALMLDSLGAQLFSNLRQVRVEGVPERFYTVYLAHHRKHVHSRAVSDFIDFVKAYPGNDAPLLEGEE